MWLLSAKLGGVVGLIGILGACSATNTASGGSGAAIRTAGLPAPEVVAAIPDAAQAEYHVGPFDVIKVSVFQVPDLDKTVQVSARGEISLPLIGTVGAGGKTVAELEDYIEARLEAKYLQNPEVSVQVEEAVSQRVTVEGAVASPGMVSLVGPTTLLQTIALSGGLDDAADPRGIVVFRTVDQQRMAAKFDLVAIRAGKTQDPLLHAGDIVVVDKSGIRGALARIREGIPVFGLFTALLI